MVRVVRNGERVTGSESDGRLVEWMVVAVVAEVDVLVVVWMVVVVVVMVLVEV